MDFDMEAETKKNDELLDLRSSKLKVLLRETSRLVKKGKLTRELPSEIWRYIFKLIPCGWWYTKEELKEFFDKHDFFVRLYLEGHDLSGLQLTEKKFYECVFEKTPLVGTNFRESYFLDCTFIENDFLNVNWTNVTCHRSKFIVSAIKDCKFYASDFRESTFEDGNISKKDNQVRESIIPSLT